MIKTIATAPGQEPIHVAMSAEEISLRQAEEAAFTAGDLARVRASAALSALAKSDDIAMRCFKAGVAFPAEWQSYVTALRAIAGGASGLLPIQPAYPAGT